MPRTAGTRAAAVIRHGSGRTSLGRAFAALSAQGLCFLRLLESEADERSALADLRELFPEAALTDDPAAIEHLLEEVDDYFAGRRADLSVPLDLRGTAFQKRVWRVMRRVPRGRTWSYSELARRAGNAKAVRAAASACAKNPIAVVVPCHRIVRNDGSLGGYGGGGPGLKKALLDREIEG